MPRDVLLQGRSRSLEDTVSWLDQHPRATLVLTGEAGEGKSTYLMALAARLNGRYLVLRWVQGSAFDLPAALQFRELVRSYFNPGEATLPVLVICELHSPLSQAQEAALIDALREREHDPANYPDLSVVIAGRPAWTGLARRSLSAQRVFLVPLARNDLALLGASITHCYERLVTRLGHDNVGDLHQAYPNLADFTRLGLEGRQKVLGGGDQPLIAGMLRAVYGDDFHRRLTDEYLSLASADRLAYLIVCLTAQPSAGISDRLLATVAPGADTAARSQLDPWTLGDDELHVPRHAIIGQTVVDAGARPLDVRLAIGKLAGAAATSAEAREVLCEILLQFADWVPVSAEGGKTSAQLRSYARNELGSDPQRWDSLEAALDQSPPVLMRWAYALRSILPDEAGKGEASIAVIQAASRLLDAAELLAADQLSRSHDVDSTMVERITFYRLLVERDRTRITGEHRRDEVEYIEALVPFIGHSWCGSDFYGQLVGMCAFALKDRMGHPSFDEHDEGDWLLLSTLTTTFQYLRSSYPVLPGIQAGYANIIGRLVFGVVHHRREQLFRLGWDLSVLLGSPDAALAVLLDDELARTDAPGHASGVAHDERLDILLRAAEGSSSYPEVLLRLLRLIGGDERLRSRLQALLPSYLAVQSTGIYRGMVLHVQAVVQQHEPEEVRYRSLRESLSLYAGGISTRDEWLTLGPYWKSAIGELARIDRVAASSARETFNGVRRRFDTVTAPSRRPTPKARR